jgi:hypothetical protein
MFMRSIPGVRAIARRCSPAALVFVLGAALAAQGLTGAIFTTDVNGTFVNANVYDDMEGPFINGGPRPNSSSCTAAGLPNGDYYFQVTDPSGANLLSSDDVSQRRVTVHGGIITNYFGSHTTAYGRCGDVTVQLFPFLATPNEGSEYKVWMTPVNRYNPATGAHGFLPKYSKTDNFKVVSTVIDSDGDGIPDADDACPDIFDPSNVCYVG